MTKFLPSVGFVYLLSLTFLLLLGLLWLALPYRHEMEYHANALHQNGEYIKAGGLYDRIRALYDTNSDKSKYYRLAAKSYFSAKQYHAAFDDLINASILEPTNIETRQALNALITDLKEVEPMVLPKLKKSLINFQTLDEETRSEINYMLE